MDGGKKIVRVLVWAGVIVLQLIMIQVVTLVASLFLPGVETYQQNQPVVFAAVVGIAFSTGVFLTGWLVLKLGWLKAKHHYAIRLAGTLIGAYVPLIVALLVYDSLEAGNPFLAISMLASILGFHVAGWI